MSQIVRRLKEYVSSKNISTRQFESRIGSATGAISRAFKKGTDIQTNTLSNVFEVYPELNPIWLMTGEGDMLRKPGKLLIIDEPDMYLHKISGDDEEFRSILMGNSELTIETREKILINEFLKVQQQLAKAVEISHSSLLDELKRKFGGN